MAFLNQMQNWQFQPRLEQLRNLVQGGLGRIQQAWQTDPYQFVYPPLRPVVRRRVEESQRLTQAMQGYPSAQAQQQLADIALRNVMMIGATSPQTTPIGQTVQSLDRLILERQKPLVLKFPQFEQEGLLRFLLQKSGIQEGQIKRIIDMFVKEQFYLP